VPRDDHVDIELDREDIYFVASRRPETRSGSMKDGEKIKTEKTIS